MTLKRASIDLIFALGGLAVIAALFLPGQQSQAPSAPAVAVVQEVPKAAPPVVAVVPPARPSRAQLVDPLFSSSAEARDRAANMELLMASSDLKAAKHDPAFRVSRGPRVDSDASVHSNPNLP